MISHLDKCIFVHIPKAAGQSVESVFVERAGLVWENRASLLLRPNDNHRLGPPRLAHLMAHEYVEYGYTTAEQFKQYFTFSFVRNPWARLVSEYKYRCQHGDKNYQIGFKKFLFKKFPTSDSDDYALAKDYYRHVIPQWQFLFDEKGNQLVDFIGKFETLQQDFNYVCQQLAIAQIMLPHKNMTKLSGTGLSGLKQKIIKQILNTLPFGRQESPVKPHYSSYYDAESQAFVADYYQKDIELFDYQFETKQVGN